MATITQYWVTTTDTPFDPFTDWDRWHHYDEFEKRYCTTELIARFNTCLDTDEEAPEYVLQESLKRAALIIVNEIPLGVEGHSYKIVTAETDVED